MYYTIIEHQEKGIKPYVVAGKNLAEITEKAKAKGRENGDKVLHICKTNMGYGSTLGKPFAGKIHRIKIDQ